MFRGDEINLVLWIVFLYCLGKLMRNLEKGFIFLDIKDVKRNGFVFGLNYGRYRFFNGKEV